MKRREFLALGAASGLAAAPSARASEQPSPISQNPEDIHAYFLEPGGLTASEQEEVEKHVAFQQELSAGSPVRLRGRPKGAPSYRLLFWDGELGAAEGRFVGPLSLQPDLESPRRLEVNAQLLNFHPCSEDWKPGQQGLLTIDLLASSTSRTPKTWHWAQAFDVVDRGISSLGFEYIAQREGVPAPIVTQESNLGVRIQLMRVREGNDFLKTIFKVASYAVNPFSLLGDAASGLAKLIPVVRVPEMAQEGIALAQAVYGSSSEKKEPLWRSHIATYGLAKGGGRMALKPGFWVILDEARQADLRDVRLEDHQGRPTLMRGGEPCDINYLVLAFEITPA
jgi:hypothetical protein